MTRLDKALEERAFDCVICSDRYTILPDAQLIVLFGSNLECAQPICPKCFGKLKEYEKSLWVKRLR